MSQKILVRYGEIGLKADFTRKVFERQLIANIRRGLASTDKEVVLKLAYGRIFLETNHPARVHTLLKQVFGVVSFSPCKETDADPAHICSLGVKEAQKFKKVHTFAVKTRRVGTHPFTSYDINTVVGERIRKKTGLTVNLTAPDVTIYVEVRGKRVYCYTEKIRGPGGLPIGTEGVVAVLIERAEGLAAAWLMMKRGCVVLPILYRKNQQYMDILQQWSVGFPLEHHLVRPGTNSLLRLLKEQDIHTLVTSPPLESVSMVKSFPGVLVLTPLMGMGKRAQRELLKRIQKPLI